MKDTVTHDEFLDERWPRFANEILEQAIRQDANIQFTFEKTEVSVSLSHPRSAYRTRLEILARSPSVFLPWALEKSKPNLFLPLFLDFYQVAIPRPSICILSRSNRSLAGFLIGNLVSHLVLGRDLHIELDPELYKVVSGHPTVLELRRMYFDRLKSFFPEENLEPRACPELLFADRIFRDLDFTSVRLNSDADEIRHLMTGNQNPFSPEELAAGIYSARGEVLKSCYE